MTLKKIKYISFISIILVLFTKCTIILTKPSLERETKTDYSFPITGIPIETNNIVSILESSLKKNNTPPPDAGILIRGQIKKPLFYNGGTNYLLGLIKLKNQGEYTHIYSLPSERKPFLWDGTITINNQSFTAEIKFDVYANKRGNNKHFILTNAILGKTHLEFDDPFDIFSGGSNYFPFLVGYVHISDNRYRLYATLDNFPGKLSYYNEIFFNPMQKFQLLDEQDIVLMEIEKDKYKIYDTMPETERNDLKSTIALIIAFRHSTYVLKNITDDWDTPLFYRYIYP